MNSEELLRDEEFVDILSRNLVQPLLHNQYTVDSEGGQRRNHVVGFGVGYKIKDGMSTGELSLVVYVREKLPLDQLSSEEQLRTRIFIDKETVSHIEEKDVFRRNVEQEGITEGGIPTDIQEIGQPSFDQLGTYTSWERPVTAGISIGWQDDTTGSVGCFVRDTKSDKICILSAAHVFGQFQNPSSGDIIIQPGGDDGGKVQYVDPASVRSQDYFHAGKFVRHVAVHQSSTGQTNTVDAAIAELIKQHEFRSRIEGGIGTPVGVGRAELSMLVHKTGRTSGYTIGRVESAKATFRLELFGVDYDFTDLIATTVMSKSGDSGSLLLSLDGNKAVGLLMGSSSSRSFFCKFENVISQLKVELP
jgi:hypothetical protein